MDLRNCNGDEAGPLFDVVNTVCMVGGMANLIIRAQLGASSQRDAPPLRLPRMHTCSSPELSALVSSSRTIFMSRARKDARGSVTGDVSRSALSLLSS